MSAPWARDLSPLSYTDYDDLSNTVLIQPGATVPVLNPLYQPSSPNGLGYQLKPYSQVCLASLGMAWDATGNTFLKWSLMINGKTDPRYINQSFAIAPPYGDAIYLPQPYWVPQLSFVDFSVTLSVNAPAPVNFTGRIIPYYFLQDPDLARSHPIARRVGTQGPRHVGTH